MGYTMKRNINTLVNKYSREIKGRHFVWTNLAGREIKCTAKGATLSSGNVVIEAVDSRNNKYLVSTDWLIN